jgi:hypothetical protein
MPDANFSLLCWSPGGLNVSKDWYAHAKYLDRALLITGLGSKFIYYRSGFFDRLDAGRSA